ncbi:glycosyltransferase [archaeon]|nr:glycosyltransferase [archaeon]
MTKLKDYAEVVGEDRIDRLYELSEKLSAKSVLHVNSTAIGGGVAEILNKMVPLMNDLGLDTRWDVMKGGYDFFNVTKKFHNSLQGAPEHITKDMLETYFKYNRINFSEMNFDKDITVIHDPQPAAMVDRSIDTKWLWRCHIDVSESMRYRPHFELIGLRRHIKKSRDSQTKVWHFLKKFVEQYDASIFSMASFARPDLKIPQYMMPPSIDPLGEKNRKLAESEIDKVLDKHGISRDKPIITQVGRFDRFKDPLGVIDAYKIAKNSVDCQLILVGGTAVDDPEGEEVFKEVQKKAAGERDIHLIILPPFSDVEINVFQSVSSVVLQKSLKEGFGLTISEALWKGVPVIGGAIGGIPSQIIDGVTGYLVHSTEGAANRIAYLLRNPDVAKRLGENGHEYVKEKFLLTRHLRDYLLIFHAIEHPNENFIEL